MKKFTLVAFFLAALISHTLAQAPQSFNYQAVARTSGGDLIASQAVGFRLSLLQGSATGTSVYVETHAISTNGFGLANLKVGEGSVVSGTFASIDWSSGPYYLKVEMDASGGTSYQLMGTSQLLSVPYALHAGSAETPDADWTVSGDDMYSAPSGNVGIGTSTPAAKLEVGGHISVVYTGRSVYLGEYAGINDEGTFRDNVFLGYGAGQLNTLGNYNTAVGTWALGDNLSGVYNTSVGGGSMGYNLDGSYNTAVGNLSLHDNTSGSQNVAIGYYSLFNNTDGSGNVSVGVRGLYHLTSGDNNTIVGYEAGENHAGSMSGSVFLGYRAGRNEGTDNRLYIENSQSDSPLIYGEFDNDILAVNGKLGVGTMTPTAPLEVAGRIAVTGTGGSVFIGSGAGANDDLTDNNNVFIGSSAGAYNTSGISNIGIGGGSLLGNSTASSNIAIGRYAMRYHEEGNANIYIGVGAGENDSFGWENTVIGYEAGLNNFDGIGNVFLGYQAGFDESGNDKLYIESSSSSTPLVYGDFASDILAVNGKLGIGTHSPEVPAHVTGGTDATLTSGGYLLAGSTSGENIVMDENEIMARNNGVANTLHVQRDGGPVAIHYGSGTNPVDEFRITSAGRTGIGVNSPSAKLHINTATAEDAVRVQVGGQTNLKVHSNGGIANYNITTPTFAFELQNSNLDLEGRGRAYSWHTFSDSRLKSNQRVIEYGLEEVMRLSPKSYDHHSSYYGEEGEFIMVSDQAAPTIGFIAQEVQKIIPEAAVEPKDEANDLWSMDYDRLIPVLTRAIQEQQAMMESMQEEIDQLKKQLTPGD